MCVPSTRPCARRRTARASTASPAPAPRRSPTRPTRPICRATSGTRCGTSRTPRRRTGPSARPSTPITAAATSTWSTARRRGTATRSPWTGTPGTGRWRSPAERSPRARGAAVPEVLVNRWSNGLARARPLPTIDHRKTLCTVAQSPREASLHRRRRTALVLSAALAAAAPLLTACGSDAHPGAAAVVGGQRITVAQLENRVTEVRDAQRAAVTDEAQYTQAIAKTGTLTRDVLHGMVLDQVLHRAAENAGVSVNRKEVQELRSGLEEQAGGAKGLETAWLQQYGIAPERLDENLLLQLEA